MSDCQCSGPGGVRMHGVRIVDLGPEDVFADVETTTSAQEQGAPCDLCEQEVREGNAKPEDVCQSSTSREVDGETMSLCGQCEEVVEENEDILGIRHS